MILELNKERKLEIDITNVEGVNFYHEGTINTKMLDVYIQAQEEMEDKLQSIKVSQEYQEIPISELTKQQRLTAMKLIQSFLGDRYEEFINFIGGKDSRYAISELGAEIIDEINKLGKNVKNEPEDEGK